MDQSNTGRVISRAKRWGLISLILFFPVIIIALVAPLTPYPPVIELIGFVVSAIYTYGNVMLIMGIRTMSLEIGDEKLEKNALALIIFSIACLFFSLQNLNSFISGSFSELLLYAFLPIIFAMGLLSIWVGNDLKRLSVQWGESSRKAGKYHRIAGYFIVSMILCPVGIIFSFAADLYLLRMIKERLNRSV